MDRIVTLGEGTKVRRRRLVEVGLMLLMVLSIAACAPIAVVDTESLADATAAAPDAAQEKMEPSADAIWETAPRNADGYADISVDQLAIMMKDKDFTLVNVHIPFQGDIPQTDLSIPYNEITDRTGELPAKNAPIVLYCRSGSMSTQAAAELADLGYTNVLELDGGFNAWQAAGHDLLNSQ